MKTVKAAQIVSFGSHYVVAKSATINPEVGTGKIVVTAKAPNGRRVSVWERDVSAYVDENMGDERLAAFHVMTMASKVVAAINA